MDFKNLKVVELASVLAGPLTGSFFSELGARVFKIENSTTGGDVTRQWKLSSENTEAPLSAYYASANYRKTVIKADLADPGDQDLVMKLIKEADILIHNFRPGKEEKYNLGYNQLKALNPRLIYGVISGFGEGDPRPAYDVILQAETGFMSMNGEPSGNPVKMPVAMIDILAAHHLKQALLVGLLKREHSGKGSYHEVSLYDAGLAALVNQASNYLMAGHVAEKMGTAHPNIAPYGDSFVAKDRKSIVLAVGNDRQFQSLAHILGIDPTPFENNQKRVDHRDALVELLQEKISQHTSEKWSALFEKNGIPFGLIKNMEDVFSEERALKNVLTEKIQGVLTKRVRTAII